MKPNEAVATPAGRFRSFGRSCQLRVDHAADLEAATRLDEALWAATSAPLGAFRADAAFLRYLDADASGRITSNEVKEAIRWTLSVLRCRDGINAGSDAIRLDDLDDTLPKGLQLKDSLRYVISARDLKAAEPVALAQIQVFLGESRNRPLNGDGVIGPEVADNEPLANYLRDAVRCTGGMSEAGGKQGVDLAMLNAFQRAVELRLAWRREAEPGPDGVSPAALPFGDATASLDAVVSQCAETLDRYFALCRALRFELGAFEPPLNLGTSLAEMLHWKTDDLDRRLGALPIAKPAVDGRLRFQSEGINPTFRDRLTALHRDVLPRVFGREIDDLDETEWRRVVAAFDPYRGYLAREGGAMAAPLSMETLTRYADGTLAECARGLLEADVSVGRILDGVRAIEKLLLYQSNLLRFANNYINFSQLYDVDERALFEVGSAVIDGRWFNLALSVEDMTGHLAMARSGGIFTIYLEVTKDGTDKRMVALPAVSGGKGNLAVGKRGVFFDLDGRQIDARIIQTIDNPISFREALFAPFVRLGDFLVGKIEAWSSTSEKQLVSGVDKMTTTSVDGAVGTPVAPSSEIRNAPAIGMGGPTGILVGVSLSMAAMGSSLAFIARTIASMHVWRLLAGLAGIVTLLMVPLSLVALTKLLRQDLSSLLEASGWAVNSRMRLSRAQRRQFTLRAPYPPHAEGTPRTARKAFVAALALTVAAWAVFRWFFS